MTALARAGHGAVAPDRVCVKALGNRAAVTAALDWYAANITERKFNVPGLGIVTVPALLVRGADQYFCKDTIELRKNLMQAPFTLRSSRV